MRRFCALALLTGWTLLAMAAPVPSPDPALEPVRWDPTTQQLGIQVRSWPLNRVLERLSQETGWHVFVEPSTSRLVDTQFAPRPVGEALQSVLGSLSFALVPQDHGPSKLLVFRTNLRQATQRIGPEARPAPEPIPNELIVKLRPGVDIDELAKRLGAKVTGRSEELNLYRLEFEDEEAAKQARNTLENSDDVEAVENNYRVPQPAPVDPLAFAQNLPLRLRPKAVGSEDQVIVGLIDTAIQRTGGPFDEFLLPSISMAGEANLPDGTPTHATAMMETLLKGLAMNTPDGTETPVRILPVDVYGDHVLSSTYDVALGIAQAINEGAMIVNLSLGSPGAASYLEQVIQSGHDQGVLFLAAAGNEPITEPTYPAALPSVLAVTAGDQDGTIASYANRGSFVDVIAPGSTVVPYGGANWYVAGTSAATAWASGFAASLAKPKGDYQAVGETLREALSAAAALSAP